MSIRVAVLGPGRVGTGLALALPDGYEVVAVAGRGAAALERFVARVPSARTATAEQAAATAGLVLLCVPDRVLPGLVHDLGSAARTGSRWVHVAGAFGVDVLGPAARAGARVAACHPAQTFPDPDAALARLPGTAWAVTCAQRERAWAEALVRDLRGEPIAVPEEARPLYHAGLAVGSNGAAAVVALARELLLAARIPDPGAFLRPLVAASVDGAAMHGARALTGPVRRGDASTVERHLAALDAELPEAGDAYVALTRLILRQSLAAGLSPAAAEAVGAVLEER